MHESRVKLVVAFGLVYTIWGSTYLAIHYAIATIPPFLMAGGRFVTAGAILLALAVTRGTALPTRVEWRNASVIGLMLLLGGNGGVVWAEQTVPSGVAALLVAIVPVWMVILEWVRPRGKPPSARVITGIAAGMLGMIVLIGFDSFRGSGPVNLFGALALMLASLFWASGSVYAGRVKLPTQVMATAVEMLVGGLGLLVFGMLTGEARHFDLRTVSVSSIVAVGYLITFGSLVAFTAYSWLLANVSSAAVGTYAYVNPIVAVLLGWAIAGESISRRELVGAAIILAAVATIATAVAPKAPRVGRAR